MIDRLSNTTKAIIVCSIAALFYCYEYYLRVAPSVISNELMDSFAISHASLGVLSAFFYYAYMPAQIPVGLLLDKYGPRLVLSIACALCVIGTYLFTATNLIWMAQIGRFLLGFGSAFAFVGFLKLCTNWLAHRYYALMVGVCTLLGMIGAMSGEIVLSWLMDYMSWQRALEFSASVGIIITFILWICLRDHPTQRNKDGHKKTHHTISNTKLWHGLIVDLKNPQIWIVGIIGCLTFLPLSSFAEMWAIPYLQEVGYSKTHAATASSMVFLGFGVGSPIWGTISNWSRSRRKPLIIGSLASAIIASLVIVFPQMPQYYMYAALFCVGLLASAEVLIFAIGNDITSKESSATTTGIINMLVMCGGIVMQPLIGYILDLLNKDSISDYQVSLIVLPVSLFIAGGLSYLLRESFTLK